MCNSIGWTAAYCLGIAMWLATALAVAEQQVTELSDALSSSPMIDQAYCGVAAVEYVTRRMDVPISNGSAYTHLKQLKKASFKDIRLALEENDLQVEAYRITSADDPLWKRMQRLLDQGTAQFIVHWHTTDPDTATTIGHFLTIEGFEEAGIRLIDPQTMTVFKAEVSKLLQESPELVVQIVQRKDWLGTYAPLSLSRIGLWLLVPALAVVVVLRRKKTKAIKLAMLLPLCCSIAGCTTQPIKPTQSVSIIEPEVDLGTFKSTDMIVTKVTVKNDSADAIALQELTLSCGCLSSTFAPTEVEAHSEFTFDVTVFNALLGPGQQYGQIATEPALAEPLIFRMAYEVEPSVYLFPDKQLVGTISLMKEPWPRIIEFDIEALEAPVDLIQPLLLETGQQAYSRPLGLDYSVVNATHLEPGGVVQIEAMPHQNSSGVFDDYFIVVAQTKSETLRFPISISGLISGD